MVCLRCTAKLLLPSALSATAVNSESPCVCACLFDLSELYLSMSLAIDFKVKTFDSCIGHLLKWWADDQQGLELGLKLEFCPSAPWQTSRKGFMSSKLENKLCGVWTVWSLTSLKVSQRYQNWGKQSSNSNTHSQGCSAVNIVQHIRCLWGPLYLFQMLYCLDKLVGILTCFSFKLCLCFHFASTG